MELLSRFFSSGERHSALLALRQSEARFREQAELLDLAPVGIFLRDLDGAIAYWNRGAEECYGWRKEEALGKISHTLLETQFPEPLEEIEAKLWHDGCWEGKLVRRRRDGRCITILSRWTLRFDEKGGPSAILEVNDDVTERKLAEEQIEALNANLARQVKERTAELAAINKELESFTYSISHDLRAPLRHMDGFSKILLENYASELEPDVRRYLGRIVQAAGHMGRLMDDLLNLSRLGRQELTPQHTELDGLVRETLDQMSSTFAGRDVEWSIQSLPAVECDAGLMRLVFQNLISNAIKFTRSRKPAVIEVGANSNASAPTFFVRDNGVGFDMKYADKLFGAFQRLHREEEFEGTGIGLATVQRILNKHGGRAWVDAQPGQGATFYFTLSPSVCPEVEQAPVRGEVCRSQR
jgi:PAS domain S-box-containing protein